MLDPPSANPLIWNPNSPHGREPDPDAWRNDFMSAWTVCTPTRVPADTLMPTGPHGAATVVTSEGVVVVVGDSAVVGVVGVGPPPPQSYWSCSACTSGSVDGSAPPLGSIQPIQTASPACTKPPPVLVPNVQSKGQSLNSLGNAESGPCPPIGRHRYFHKLYALDVVLTGLGTPNKPALEAAMHGHVIAKAELVGTYQKRGAK